MSNIQGNNPSQPLDNLNENITSLEPSNPYSSGSDAGFSSSTTDGANVTPIYSTTSRLVTNSGASIPLSENSSNNNNTNSDTNNNSRSSTRNHTNNLNDSNPSNNYNYINNVNAISNNRNTMNVPLLGVRDRLFHAIFFKASVTYARSVPSSVRRVIEFLILLKAVTAFFMLIYVHTTFIHKPTECLSHLKNTWPKDGILRVEILRNGGAEYTIENSYAKERRIEQQRFNEMNLLLTTFKFPMEWPSEVHLESSLDEDTPFQETDNKDKDKEEVLFADEPIENISSVAWIDGNKSLFSSAWDDISQFGGTQDFSRDKDFESDIGANGQFNETLLQSSSASKDTTEKSQSHRTSSPLKESVSEMEKLVRAVWPEEEYILEFSLEYGFLRLSPQTREKLKIPVKIVTLDPTKDTCFGDDVTRFILEHFIGYDDLLMVSIKTLAEKENNKGFLRNVVTGEHYRFVTMWMSRASYLFAFGMMIVFTLSLTILLRYSHHQIFIFIVDLLQMLEFNSAISFPAAPLLTIILALIGMEAVMSEFFNDNTTAFYIIVIVWISNQYEAACCYRPITKKHWVRFFYLYHFSFYAYHYRFNGQYSGLALITSWLFIEHSMIYFYHHYELPFVLQRHNLQQFIMAQQTAATNDSVSFLNRADRRNEDDSNTRNAAGRPNNGGGNAAVSTGAGSSSANEDVSVELRSQNEMQSIFSNITRRLLFRRRPHNNVPTPETSDSITQTSAFYADQQVTTGQYVNEEQGALFGPQQVHEQLMEDIGANGRGRDSHKTAVNAMSSSFSPDIIASTSKSVVSSPDVVTSSSTEKTAATVASTATDYSQNRTQTTINSSASSNNLLNKRCLSDENPNNDVIRTQNDDDTGVRLEPANMS
ncbi:membralin [Planococcus citri]|uniref:membralin n=1 Tax=Planococcus citri TaxID=170843 RepID=UPI0031F8A2E9